VVDVSSPSTPREVGYYDTPRGALGVAVAGSYAYVADGEGLRVVDVSSPSTPRGVGYYDTPGDALGVAVAGSYAYVACEMAGLSVVDVSSPSTPREVGYYDTPGYAGGVAVAGSYAYVADGRAGLRVVDVSRSSNPRLVGYYDTPGGALGVAVAGSFAYVADATNLGIYDCSEATAVALIEGTTIPNDYFIASNYPNPFNSNTLITYGLPRNGIVSIKVLDLRGNVVETIYNGYRSAGSYNLYWGGSHLPSGVYLLRLEAGGYTDEKQMILVR